MPHTQNFRHSQFQAALTQILKTYWVTTFGYVDGATPPSFEDHFTMLDLAANTGHHLGPEFSPKQLRAIRRLSIHRVFEILDEQYYESLPLRAFLNSLATGRRNAVVTTNWDISIEKHFQQNRYTYSIEMHKPDGRPWVQRGVPILKLHGSANWAYCDCCGQLIAFGIEQGKGALNQHIFIDPDDFYALGDEVAATHAPSGSAQCRSCRVKLSSRVATFSYTKTLGFVHFQAIWDNAFKALRRAKHWIFAGYSFPEADFQLRHMLKTAQLGGSVRRELKVTVITKGNQDGTLERFQRFFGTALTSQHDRGFRQWLVDTRI